MKVGLSYSRCVLDIVLGKVQTKDVLVIVSRTDFDPENDEHWKNIWEGYIYGGLSNPEWAGFEDREEEFKQITLDLYRAGKLHQPRQFGVKPQYSTRNHRHWLETVLPTQAHEKNPAVKQAWEQYQLLAGLANKQPQLKDDF